ncbi:uncharacterized protein VNE69_10026 [Vairimorpha necatrix]|uniref:Uncharacterized protein n=1 Tax=Vairimorpha necatrix TaxID=6039 RepID=A0AAX4JFE3_9MICR
MSSKLKRNKSVSIEDDKSAALLLKSSIDQEDTSYLSEYLLQKNSHRQLKYLEDTDLENLSVLLLDFLCTPQRLLALEILKKLTNNKILPSLKQRALEFDKLVYLKGKIDFIKMKCTKNVKHKPEMEINLENIENKE